MMTKLQTEEKEEHGFIIVIHHEMCHLARIIYLLHERYPQVVN
jgi:predicted SprT family Zn-dependent metalloprotease